MKRPSDLITLLDACAVVNLYATRRMAHILAVAGGRFGVVDAVSLEAQYVLRGGDGADAREREPVDLQPLLGDALLEVIVAEDEEELLTFIDLREVIGQGEAMTAAVAIHRGCIVVTDDRKASRVLTDRGVAVRSSLDLIRVWSESPALTQEIVRAALTDLRQRGSYEPSRAHPMREWWDRVMSGP